MRHALGHEEHPTASPSLHRPDPTAAEQGDAYFSADVETDGPIPGPFSLLSFALVYVGRFDGVTFEQAENFDRSYYAELKPISDSFEEEAMRVNNLDREKLRLVGQEPSVAMTEASHWVREAADGRRPVLVAYPLSFDWPWLYWYFVRYSQNGSPFNHSSCFDIKTAYALKAQIPIAAAGRSRIARTLRPDRPHKHHALADAIEQAEIFTKLWNWRKTDGGSP